MPVRRGVAPDAGETDFEAIGDVPHVNNMSHKFAFLDTPIFLHCRPFDEIDWLSALDTETATIVIAPITISELNEKKDEGKPKQRQRAALALKRLESLSSTDNPLRSGVALLIQDTEPSVDYRAHHLDHSCQDDRLLAAILDFRATNPAAKLLLVSPDFGLRLKAKRLGIEGLCLNDDLKLPDEQDPSEKRIQQLEQEVLELKRVMPELELTFPGGRDRLEVDLELPITLTADDIRRENELTRLEYPKLGESSHVDSASSAGLAELVADFYRPSKETIGKYNAELERFYSKHDAWVASKTSDLNRQRRTVRLELILGNNGTAPAKDIDVFIYFPDGFELYRKENLAGIAEEPKPPQRPGLSSFSSMLADLQPPLWNFQIPKVGPTNVSAPYIRKTNSYEVRIHVEQQKHRLEQRIALLYVVFESFEAARSFNFHYSLVAANLPKPTEGYLHVIVKKGTASSSEETVNTESKE